MRKQNSTSGIAVLLWDIGGVLLTNGWGRDSREEAARVFNIEFDEFQTRHAALVDEFEQGRVSLHTYLQRTVFHQPRSFGEEEVVQFMLARSQPHHETLALMKALAKNEVYLMGVLNNESFELNQYRIERFELARYFDVFISSCYVGLQKPDDRIYALALRLIQRRPEECLFIDDRAPNLEPAKRLGIRTIHYRSVTQLREELLSHGIRPETE
jgi:putative hydrolase of the HAD superfamily